MIDISRGLRLRFERPLAVGDYVVTTALVRDIRRAYGDELPVVFDSPFPELYACDPSRPSASRLLDAGTLTLCYKAAMDRSRQGVRRHFIEALHADFNQKTGLSVKLTAPRPELFLSQYERTHSPVSGRYWLIFAGGKADFTVKHWSYSRCQTLVDKLSDHGVHCIQTGGSGHLHPPLRRIPSLVGWGGIRELLWQIFHAEGVICPITCAMHIAAAFKKPCVVIAGGREEPWWEAYDPKYGQFDEAEEVEVPHVFLHTVGALDCCKNAGCWKNKVIATEDDKNACTNLAPSRLGLQVLPQCMNSIVDYSVFNAVMFYYLNGYLPTTDGKTRPVVAVARG